MKKQSKFLNMLLIAITLILSTITIHPTSASSTQTMYVEPSNYIFDIYNATVGTRFNATVWVSSSSYPWSLMMFQVYIIYNHQYINVTRFWGTITNDWSIRAWPNQNLGDRNWDDSYVFKGKSGGAVGNPVYYNIDATHGAVMIGDLLASQTSVSGPKKLACFEFEIKSLPSEGQTLSCALNIDNDDTYLFDNTGPITGVTKQNGYYEISSPGPPPPPPPTPEAKICVEPAEIIDPTMVPSSTFDINITVVNVTKMLVCQFNLTYNPNVLQWTGIKTFKVFDQFPNLTINSNCELGYIWVKLDYDPSISTSPPLALVNIMFHVRAYGSSVLDLHDTELLDFNGEPIEHEAKDGFFMSLIRDVAVTNIFLSRTWAYKGWPVNITLTVKNLGNINETFNVTAYYDANPIEMITVIDLPPNISQNVTITWNTSDVDEGIYTIKGEASTVPYESNTANNLLVDSTVSILTVKRDVAVINVVADKTFAYQGQNVNINVTVKNTGEITETFDVTAFYDGNMLYQNNIIDLPPGVEVTLSFTWNTSSVTPDNYTISAEASLVPYEYNVTNNSYINGVIEVRIAGDVNGDGRVDMLDMWLAQEAFGSSPGHPRWNPYADINGSQRVDMLDIYIVQKNFGAH